MADADAQVVRQPERPVVGIVNGQPVERGDTDKIGQRQRLDRAGLPADLRRPEFLEVGEEQRHAPLVVHLGWPQRPGALVLRVVMHDHPVRLCRYQFGHDVDQR